jgi:CheY-like chemotaxis protein
MQKKPTCLLIDNDVDDQEIFSMALGEIDSTISCLMADDGLSAIEKLTTNPGYTLSYIFIDMNMPLMDGKQCLQEIRKIPAYAQVPIYIYSTAANPTLVAEAKALGATDFIMKPAGFRELVELLANLVHPKILS